MPKGKDYDVFKKIVLKAENDNEQDKVAEIVTSLYGTPKEQLQVKRINDKQKRDNDISREDFAKRAKISSKYYYKLMNEKSKINNGYMKKDKLYKMEKKGLI
tara:strand:+ start:123 stop:428 length:306 start_codon:yes stop_codon:yes gene_type:complete